MEGNFFTKSKIFLGACVCFIAGIVLASWLPPEWAERDLAWFVGLTGGAVILFLFWQIKSLRIAALWGLFLFLGLWRYGFSLPLNAPDKIWRYNGQTVNVQGIICNEPDVRQNNQKLEMCAENLSFFPERRVEGKILITTNLYPVYNYGERLEIICALEAPDKFRGFSYDRYLARYNIYSVCYYPRIETGVSADAVEKPAGNKLRAGLLQFKNKLRATIAYGLAEPEAGLAQAIFLGYKKNIPPALRADFSRVGLSHIIAISGMHISILAAMLMGLFLSLGLSRKKSFWLSAGLLLSYIILIGWPASAMRAGLMGFLLLWAMNLGRLSKSANSVVMAGAVLLLINPKLLRDDIGFQLSFLAVLGIIWFYPFLDRWTAKIKNPPKLLKAGISLVNITVAAQILTLPVLAYNFSQVSLIAPVSNLLVLWALPIMLATILGGLFLSLILSGGAFLFFLPAYFLLKYIIVVAGWLSRLPGAYVEIDYLWWGWAAVYYGVVLWILYKAHNVERVMHNV